LTIIIPKESGPKASSKVEKETFPGGVGQQIVPGSVYNGVLPFFKSSRLTVTAVKDIITGSFQQGGN
jgi:hypothetical protein